MTKEEEYKYVIKPKLKPKLYVTNIKIIPDVIITAEVIVRPKKKKLNVR